MDQSSSSESQWRPLLWVAALAFLILFSYGLARSAIDALLQEDNGKDATKYAYALVALSVTIIVPLYSRAASKLPIGVVIALCAVATASTLSLLLGARMMHVPFASYALYIWKDVYVVVLVELVWTLANLAFKTNTAKWAYGFFCVAGTLGELSGNYASGQLAHSVGSAELLWIIVPTIGATTVVGLKAAHACGWPQPSGKGTLDGVVSVVRASRSIQLLLALVTVIQIVTTLIDFRFLTATYEAYPLLDDRTEVFTQVHMTIGLGSLVLQLLSGAIVTVIGVRALIIVLPIVLGGAAIYASIHPTFLGLAVLKIVNKGLDYSLFRTTKELLYRPLSYEERTLGKAAVDILGYRAAKGAASGLLMAMSGLAALVTVATVAGIGIWLVLSVFLGLHFVHEPKKNGRAEGITSSIS
ncbi:MAG: hypothetical protein GY811_07590 [Myxococcales bacterium]|nr:hypothetical protein [Myxococcales bacterium]